MVVDGDVVGEIGAGVCVLLGVARDDGEDEAAALAGKIARLRIFQNDQGKFDRSLLDTGGGVLVVSQFTLYADTRKGRRPSWVEAAAPEVAEALVQRFVTALTDLGASVATGRFRAHMQVALENDGPVTLLVEVSAEDGG